MIFGISVCVCLLFSFLFFSVLLMSMSRQERRYKHIPSVVFDFRITFLTGTVAGIMKAGSAGHRDETDHEEQD